jgi:hypothetical protein
MLGAVDAIGRRGGNAGIGPAGGVDHDEAAMAISARRKRNRFFAKKRAKTKKTEAFGDSSESSIAACSLKFV